MMNELSSCKSRSDKIGESIVVNNHQIDSFIGKKAELIINMQESREFLDNSDEISSILEDLNKKTQSKTKSIYESLLTSLLREVKGIDPENKEVVLSTSVKANKPWLDIEIINDKGFRRDVFLDKGFSVRDILAIGLRFIALSRSTNRRIVLLDEPDKSLNPLYIPSLARMISQLSQKIGIQVVYISHHNPASFEGCAKIIHLTRKNGKVVPETIMDYDHKGIDAESNLDLSFKESFEDSTIKYVRLVDVKQHENSMIELSPYVTVISGDMDLGKSTIIQAIDAVIKNGGREGLIRDDAPSCKVEIGLNDDFTLSFSYKRKGSNKTLYELKDDSNQLIETHNKANVVPEWLNMYMAMPLINDIDLHIAHQGKQEFILDNNAFSGHKRAEILCLSDEADMVQGMILQHNQKIDKNKKQLNLWSAELNKVKNTIHAYRHNDDLVAIHNEINGYIHGIHKCEADLEKLNSIIGQLSSLSTTSDVYKNYSLKVVDLSVCNQKDNLENIFSLIEAIHNLTMTCAVVGDIPEKIDVDVISEYSNLAGYRKLIVELISLKQQENALNQIQQCEYIDMDSVFQEIRSIESSMVLMKELSVLYKKSEAMNIQVEKVNTDVRDDHSDFELRELQVIIKFMESNQQNSQNVDSALNSLRLDLINTNKMIEEAQRKSKKCNQCGSLLVRGAACHS